MLGLYARPQSPLDAGAGAGTALDGAPGEPATVLVVEDDPALRALLLELLEGEDYRVLVAGEGRTGLALARQHCPHAILLDIGPPGISGWAVLQQLRASGRTRHIPVVALTGRSELAADAGGQAPDACVAKPFDILHAAGAPRTRGGVGPARAECRRSSVVMQADGWDGAATVLSVLTVAARSRSGPAAMGSDPRPSSRPPRTSSAGSATATRRPGCGWSTVPRAIARSNTPPEPWPRMRRWRGGSRAGRASRATSRRPRNWSARPPRRTACTSRSDTCLRACRSPAPAARPDA